MTLSASEFYEAGMSLPPTVRKDVALRLLRTVDSEDLQVDGTEAWLRGEAAAAYDALKADPSRGVPADEVRAHFEEKWAARS
ncbi:MAG: addiction module protein [Aeromicrobium sp.]|uniref:addiction module protein n=1 Tax=Aeromicrobium sp. TaxID=1871063 RepID=UPI0039E630F6